MDPTWFMVSSLFSLIGFAVFTYGRRQHTATHLVIGIALMAYPYFVSSVYALVGIGTLLLVGMVVGNRFENE